MIDIDKIYESFKEMLNEFDDDKLDAWLKMDETRLLISKIQENNNDFECNAPNITYCKQIIYPEYSCLKCKFYKK